MRIANHKILSPNKSEKVTIKLNGQAVEALSGEPLLAALWANDILTCRSTAKYKEPRGCYCGIGRCGECRMVVNGKKDVRTCITLVEDGINVEKQED